MTSTSTLPNYEPLDQSTTPLDSVKLLEQRESLLRVLELFRQRDLWKALEQVLRAEQLSHLRVAAFSSSKEQREASRYIAHWLESVINGGLESYRDQADATLNPDDYQPDAPPPLQEMDSGADYLND